MLRRARGIYRESRADYAASWQVFARDHDLGHLHTDPTTEAVVNETCHDLLLCIGVILVTTNWRRRRPHRK